MAIPVTFTQRRSNPIAIITGVNGQDGSYLAELLLEKGYTVIGIIRRYSSGGNVDRLKGILGHKYFQLVEGDVTDPSNVNSWIREFRPDEVYNLAAQSHVGTSFKQPNLTWKVNAEGVINILEAIKNIKPDTKLYQASTSEMFGKNYSLTVLDEEPFGNPMKQTLKTEKFQDENTPFAPQSPYGVAKVAAHQSVQMYRRAFGIHGSCGILFNHESPRRGNNFVTRKITKWIGEYVDWHHDMLAKIDFHNLHARTGESASSIPKFSNELILLLDNQFPKLRLGNLDAYRDWGHARDYVEAMWMMLQQDEPDDYVVCTGETLSVKDFLRMSFYSADIHDYENYYLIDPKFYRPAEVEYLKGDSTKIREKLGWKPKTSINELVDEMISNDVLFKSYGRT